MAATSTLGPDDAPPIRHSPRPYAYVFIMLAVVTVLEVYVAGLPFVKTDQILLLLLMATAKASLVVLYYMHLRYERRALRWVALAPFFLAVAFAGVLIV